ncbi:hypothetical protein [Lactiplantibacillus plantarum]|uniref:hypothetical protein n=1 Tax=Lactiplantibacillus plantarum TaxID=1590 RepID=UPI0005EE6300|nr:hypothetical protein [Lactiplantibacillus plantarum]KZV06526.1 hypothetical protein Nizo3893_0078 [Lactiplantibacillus plantarum]
MLNNEMRAHDLAMLVAKRTLDGMTEDGIANEFSNLSRAIENSQSGNPSNETSLFFVYQSFYQKFLTLLNEDDQQENQKG